MPADILLYAVIAAGLVFWLRSLLGTRHDDEPQRENPFTSLPETKSGKDGFLTPVAGIQDDYIDNMADSLGRNMSIANDEAKAGLADIVQADKGFDLLNFMVGAQDAFVIIVESFAEGDRDTLKGLLSEPLYKTFEKEITRRENDGEEASMEIHAVRHADLIDAHVKDKTAFITVKFTADETSVIRDKDGDILSGNPDRVTETIDIWTFARVLRSRDPAWLVCETREAEDDPVPGSHVPEGS